MTKWFQWHFDPSILKFFDAMITSKQNARLRNETKRLHRRFVLQLGTANFIQLIFKNLTCIAGNFFDVLCVRQLTLIGTSHGIPYFMHCQQPGQYHDLLFHYRTKNPRITFDNLEGALIHAGLRGGNSCRDILHFRPSPQLQSLRRARRTTLDAERQKTLSLQIRKLQQREAKSWKSEQLRLKLGRVVHWKS